MAKIEENIKEAQALMERVDTYQNYYKDNQKKEKIFEVYEPQGTYNGARYISFNVNEEKTILREAIDWETPDNARGGIITLSTDCNALELDKNRFLNAIKQFIQTWKQRLTYTKTIDKVAQDYNLVGWTVGKYLNGRYTGKDGNVYDENSITIEVVGVTSDKLIAIAEDLCRLFNQEGVMVKDYNNGKVLFVNSK